MGNLRLAPRPLPELINVALFLSAEEAWFWYVRCETARLEGVRFHAEADEMRPCDPDDIYRAVMRLYRTGRIVAGHLKVIGCFGRMGFPPDPRSREEEMAARIWDETMDLLHTILKGKGIIQ